MDASIPIEDANDAKSKRKPKLKPKARHGAVAALLSGGLTQIEAAQAIGVSRATLQRDLADMKEGLQVADSVLARAQAHIKVAKIEVERRVERYAELAQQDAQPSSALAALIRLDAIDGLVPEIDRLRARIETDQRTNQPMFSIVGAVSVTVNAPQPQPVVDPPVIDVTPKPSS